MLLLLVLLINESVTTILLLVYQPALLWRILTYSPFNLYPTFLVYAVAPGCTLK
jgi:hypothetical protein